MKIINTNVERWDIFEVVLQSDHQYDNPFTDVELQATFSTGNTTIRVDGFYDGDSTWRIRFMPEMIGNYQFQTTSNDDNLDGLMGSFESVEPKR